MKNPMQEILDGFVQEVRERRDEAERRQQRGQRIFYAFVVSLCCLAVAVVCGL